MPPTTTDYVFPARPPIDDLWPVADYAVHCRPGGVTQARDYKGRVTGMVCQNVDGSFYVLMSPALNASDEVWKPLDATNILYVRIYYRVGPCWIGGHGHGEDGEVGNHVLYAKEVLGLTIEQNGMEDVDIRYYPVGNAPWGLRYLRNEYNKIHGSGEPDAPVVQPPPAPPTPPVIPVSPPAPPVQPPVVSPAPTTPVLPAPAPPTLSSTSKQTIKDLRARIAAGKRIGDNLQQRLVTLLNEVEKVLS